MKNLENLSVYEAEKQIKNYLRTFQVSKPKEPLLASNKPTKENIDDYAKKLEQYNLDLVKYKIENDFFKSEYKRLYELLEDLIKENSGLNNIPEQYRSKVYQYACQQGHGSGYGEVYGYLLDLVGIFK